MNVPPASPMVPPPPPPAAKGSSVWKWILIGCGVFAFLGVLACGGCTLFVYFAVKKAATEKLDELKPVLQQNPVVKEKVGTIQSIEPNFSGFKSETNGNETRLQCTATITGDKGKGTLAVKLRSTRGGGNSAIAVINFVDEAGHSTPIGIWKGHGDQWTPLSKEPDDE